MPLSRPPEALFLFALSRLYYLCVGKRGGEFWSSYLCPTFVAKEVSLVCLRPALGTKCHLRSTYFCPTLSAKEVSLAYLCSTLGTRCHLRRSRLRPTLSAEEVFLVYLCSTLGTRCHFHPFLIIRLAGLIKPEILVRALYHPTLSLDIG